MHAHTHTGKAFRVQRTNKWDLMAERQMRRAALFETFSSLLIRFGGRLARIKVNYSNNARQNESLDESFESIVGEIATDRTELTELDIAVSLTRTGYVLLERDFDQD